MIVNEHISLRPSNLTDLTFRYNWFNDQEFALLYLGKPVPVSYRQLEEEIMFSTYPVVSSGLFELAIVNTLENVYIGNVFFRKIDWQNRSAEYGIFIGNKEQWGKKIGSEVTRVMLKYGFTELGLRRIWLTALAYNGRAIRCFEKSGFQTEGILRSAIFSGGKFSDVMLMSIIGS